MKMLHMMDEEHLDNLPCPECGEPAVTTWFARPRKVYRTYFGCLNCGFEVSAQCVGIPAFYRKDRDRTVAKETAPAEG